MKRKVLAPFLILSIFILGVPAVVFAHGVKMAYQIRNTVEITAAFDTGEPFSGGQVTIYAPDNPSTPWLTGKCDEKGRFTFTPDTSKPGTWDVKVRHAGHGGMIHISVDENMTAAGKIGYTPMQIVLMAACVVWGFVGTTLFLSRRKS